MPVLESSCFSASLEVLHVHDFALGLAPLDQLFLGGFPHLQLLAIGVFVIAGDGAGWLVTQNARILATMPVALDLWGGVGMGGRADLAIAGQRAPSNQGEDADEAIFDDAMGAAVLSHVCALLPFSGAAAAGSVLHLELSDIRILPSAPVLAGLSAVFPAVTNLYLDRVVMDDVSVLDAISSFKHLRHFRFQPLGMRACVLVGAFAAYASSKQGPFELEVVLERRGDGEDEAENDLIDEVLDAWATVSAAVQLCCTSPRATVVLLLSTSLD